MDERAFYRETNVTRSIELNCPSCRTVEKYELAWCVRLKKDQMPSGGDERDRARFAKALSYMVLLDDKVACKNLSCRKRFDVSGIKTMAFLSTEQDVEFRQQVRSDVAARSSDRPRSTQQSRSPGKSRPTRQPRPDRESRPARQPRSEGRAADQRPARRPRSGSNPHRPSY